MKKNWKWIILSIGVVVIIISFVKTAASFNQAVKALSADDENDPPMTYSVTAEDSLVIDKKYLPMLKVHENLHSTFRTPVSYCYLGEFYLIVYKIDSAADIALSNLVHINDKGGELANGETYRSMQGGGFPIFKWRYARPEPVSKIYAEIVGDSLSSIVSNDSIVSCHLLCKRFSVRYNE